MPTGILDRLDPHVRFAPHFPLHRQPSAFVVWCDRQRQRIHLSHLDDRMLDDIGVSRFAATEEARKWT